METTSPKPAPTPIRRSLVAVLTVLCIGGIGTYLFSMTHARNGRQADTSATVPFPGTDEGIHIGINSYSLLPSYLKTNPQALFAVKVDYVWSSLPHHTVELPHSHLDKYLAALWLDGNAAGPRGNHDLVWFQANHPSWIAYRCDTGGNPTTTPAYYSYGTPNQLNGRIPLDFTNPEVQQYLLQQADRFLQSGYDGIALDDILFTNFQSVCGTYQVQPNEQLTPDKWKSFGYPPGTTESNPKLRADILQYLQFMHDNIKRDFPKKSIDVNVNAFTNSKAGVPITTILPYVDGVLDENGFTGGGYRNATDAQWRALVNEAEAINAAGKAFTVGASAQWSPTAVYPMPEQWRPPAISWALANYLLVKGGHSYTYIQRLEIPYVDLPQYHVPIGHPASARFSSNGVQMRKYSGGLAIVNPSATATFTVPLDHPYQDMYGNTVCGNVTLTPASGTVLLNSASASCPSAQ